MIYRKFNDSLVLIMKNHLLALPFAAAAIKRSNFGAKNQTQAICITLPPLALKTRVLE